MTLNNSRSSLIRDISSYILRLLPNLRGLSRVSFLVNYLMDYLGRAISRLYSLALCIKRVFRFIDFDCNMKFSWKKLVYLAESTLSATYFIMEEGGV